jgi:hypothetical protein
LLPLYNYCRIHFHCMEAVRILNVIYNTLYLTHKNK